MRIEEEGVAGERYADEVVITGPARLGRIEGKRVAVETDYAITEIKHHD